MDNKEINKLQQQTVQYAIEYITGKGLHSGIAWLRDSFNELCEAMGANEWKPEDIGFELDDLVENLKKAPWVAEIAGKSASKRTSEDISRVVEDFICEFWLTKPEEVTTKDVADVLRVADPLSKRHLVANKVAIECIRPLSHDELYRLDGVLADLEKNPNYGMNNGLKI